MAKGKKEVLKNPVVCMEWELRNPFYLNPKPAGYTLHATEEDQHDYVNNFLSSWVNISIGSQTTLNPSRSYLIGVDQKTYELIKASNNGLRFVLIKPQPRIQTGWKIVTEILQFFQVTS